LVLIIASIIVSVLQYTSWSVFSLQLLLKGAVELRPSTLLSKCAFVTGKAFSLMTPPLIGLFFESTLLSGTKSRTKVALYITYFTESSNTCQYSSRITCSGSATPSIASPPNDGGGCLDCCCCTCQLYASSHYSFLFETKVRTISLLFFSAFKLDTSSFLFMGVS
jgi:hypothetical protein